MDYFALDVSYQELHRTLSIVPPGTFRHVRCFGLLGTYDDGHNWMQLPEIRSRSKTILSLGSTLGSFQRPEAADFLASFVTPENNSSLLIGLDGCKDADRVLAAYNDTEGFNRRFIKHGLERANEILGPDTFDLDKWDVIGRWDAAQGSHNQYYVPSEEVSLTGETIPAGRSILAIKSHKYDADDRDALCRRADLAVSDAWASKNQYSKFIYSPLSLLVPSFKLTSGMGLLSLHTQLTRSQIYCILRNHRVSPTSQKHADNRIRNICFPGDCLNPITHCCIYLI